jgi:hypothetical protein
MQEENMGQGFVLANLDKREYVSPHDLGLGYKLGEFGMPKRDFAGSLVQFARELTAEGGEWHGDRVAYLGDYGDMFGLDFGDLPSEILADFDNSDGEGYDLVYREFARMPKDKIRSWVATKVGSDNLAFRRRLWAGHDEVEKHFANK